MLRENSYHALAPPQSMWKSTKAFRWDMKQYFCTLGYIMSSMQCVGSNWRLLKCGGQAWSIQSTSRTILGLPICVSNLVLENSRPRMTEQGVLERSAVSK